MNIGRLVQVVTDNRRREVPTDNGVSRTIVLSIFSPTDKLPHSAIPYTELFAPAFEFDRDMYVYNIEALIKAGFVAVTVGAPYEFIFTVMPDGEIIRQSDKVQGLDGADLAA